MRVGLMQLLRLQEQSGRRTTECATSVCVAFWKKFRMTALRIELSRALSGPRVRPFRRPCFSYSLIVRASSLIGYPADYPLDDRVESMLIESVPAWDAELGDEAADDLGHDLVCVP